MKLKKDNVKNIKENKEKWKMKEMEEACVKGQR